MDKTFGTRLCSLRKKNNMTQKELALKLEISPSAVSMYEKNKREPDSEVLSKICTLFETTSDYLLGIDEIEKEKNVEISEIVDDLVNKLIKQKGLMYNGSPVNEDDLITITDAIRIAAECALKYNAKRKGD